jgi:hypothetical protein|tara:strand:+ start:242 stop:619 length:378 start_codon:yes stop_codon:yes gene_type:complete
MATNATWTVIFDDKIIINQSVLNADGFGTAYKIVDNDFWGLAKWNNIWAIQYGTSNPSDTVEYRDSTPHSTWEDANLGDFQDFITKWDTAHLAQLQSDWDDDNVDGESEADKIARLGERPTSYSS